MSSLRVWSLKPVTLFLQACAGHVLRGAGRVLDEDAARPYAENTGHLSRTVSGVVRPETVEEVMAVVELAKQFAVALYPVSQGRNWGFGSRLPVREAGNVIVDLSRMNRIRHLDDDDGYVIIEPGVTQAQLEAHLTDAGAKHFLDVTGSGRETSVLGNALERGIAYNSLRVDALSALEVVLGNGQRLHTGFGQNVATRHTYKHGIGPSLDGLFFQSNFGIVTSGTYRLLRRRPQHLTFHLGLSAEALPEFVSRLRTLREEYPFDSIVHIGNRARTRFTLQPLVNQYAREANLSPERAWAAVDRETGNEWTAVGNIKGTRAVVAELERAVKKTFGPLGALRLYSPRLLKFGTAVSRVLGLTGLGMKLKVASTFDGLNHGVPSDAALHAFVDDGNRALTPAESVDRSRTGFSYCVPLAPLTGFDAQRLVDTAHRVCGEFGFTAEMTLNALTAQVLEAVISVSFSKDQAHAPERASRCMRALHTGLMAQGYAPYRVSIELMDLIAQPASAQWQTVKQLKEVLDPHRIIAPGRYNLV